MRETADACGYHEDGRVKGCGKGGKGRKDWEKRKGQARRPRGLREPMAFTCTHKVSIIF